MAAYKEEVEWKGINSTTHLFYLVLLSRRSAGFEWQLLIFSATLSGWWMADFTKYTEQKHSSKQVGHKGWANPLSPKKEGPPPTLLSETLSIKKIYFLTTFLEIFFEGASQLWQQILGRKFHIRCAFFTPYCTWSPNYSVLVFYLSILSQVVSELFSSCLVLVCASKKV
jgi:hypothetical protein